LRLFNNLDIILGDAYTLVFCVLIATLGQPYLREVAQELTKTIITIKRVAAKNLFFISWVFVIVITNCLDNYYVNIACNPLIYCLFLQPISLTKAKLLVIYASAMVNHPNFILIKTAKTYLYRPINTRNNY
jgi:hypothetical protein